jgi:hypothetical protein
MAKIDEITENKIKQSAKITDVLEDAGYTLVRNGANWACLCPFHEDRRIGSFVINARKNYYKCFSCGEKGDPLKFVMKYHGKTYNEALRYLAAMYRIVVDDQPVPTVIKREPRKPLPPTELRTWPIEIIKPYLQQTTNPLINWMLALPMNEEQKLRLRNMIQLYLVGTSLKGHTKDWTMWPLVDHEMRVRDIKFMAYKEDGHRDKDRPAPWDKSKTYSVNWMKSMLKREGKFNEDTHHVERCLFGLHLLNMFPNAEICLVESEKTAVICSAFSDPNERLWMATGGMQNFIPAQLKPLIDAQRYVVYFPDVDGEQAWREMADIIDYPRMTMTGKMKPIAKGGLYNPAVDSPKADIADILIRIMHGIEESPAEKAARWLNATPEQAENLKLLMDKLHITDIQLQTL